MGVQGGSGQKQPQSAISRQPGLDPADYEIAAQLINHAQGRRESGSARSERETINHLARRDNGEAPQNGMKEGDSHIEHPTESRQSSSPEHTGESQYSPLNVQATNGQRCR